MKIFKGLFLGVLSALSISCSSDEKTSNTEVKKSIDLQNKYSNVIDIRENLASYRDINTTMFSDLGAWHAYAVSKEENVYGGFSGPMLMDIGGSWLSDNFAKILIEKNNLLLDLSKADREIEYFPGKLVLSYKLQDLIINQTLIFTDSRNSIIKTELVNTSKEKIDLRIIIEGELFEGINSKIELDNNNTLSVKLDDKSRLFEQIFIPIPENIEITNSEQSYNAKFKKIVLSKGESKEYYYRQKHDFEESSFNNIGFDKALKDNKVRWNSYLDSYFANNSRLLENEKYRKLAVKSIITLISNWRSAAKDLLHDGTFPSISYQGFYGFWSWDSWKHAVAYADFAPEIAKNNFRSMFDFQDKYGMVADCIYTDKSENNWRDTKPPLASWGVWKIYEATNDVEFLNEMFPKLEIYHQWWYANRDNDSNLLCEYGSTDGTRIAAAWESGMDNAVRFDDATMLKNNDNAWSLDQESVDLNSYLFRDKLYLAKIAKVLNEDAKSKIYVSEAADLQKLIIAKMYNSDNGYFYDISLADKKQILIDGPEGWIPMWSNMLNEEMAAKTISVILDTNKFNTKVPFPTLSAAHENFNPLKGYWRGPVWLDQAYFGIVGMRNYGYDKEADELTLKIFNNSEGMLSDKPIRENYHPITGKGLNAKNFSWSAAHVLLMLKQ